MRVIRIEKSVLPWKEVVIFEATKDTKTQMGHLLGTKIFYVERGERVRIRIPKSWCLEVGDNVKLSSLVLHKQEVFNWYWW